MQTRRHLVSRFLTAALTLTLAGVPVAITLAGSGGESTALTPAAPPLTPNGWLTISTGPGTQNDRVGLDADRNGTPEQTQALSAGRIAGSAPMEACSPSRERLPRPVSWNVASFASDSLGVAEKKSGTSCSQVGLPGEALTLDLNPANVKGSLGGLVATSAVLDVELKQGAQILAVLQRGTQVAYRELRSGTSVTAPKARPAGYPAAASTEVSVCNNIADSGPDAGVLDNCRWAISNPSWQPTDDGVSFDKITLIVLNGAFSVEGGGDGIVTTWSMSSGSSDQPPTGTVQPGRSSFFELADAPDGILTCDGVTVTRDAVGTSPEVTVRRLDNVNGACVAIPYRLTSQPLGAQFLNPPRTSPRRSSWPTSSGRSQRARPPRASHP